MAVADDRCNRLLAGLDRLETIVRDSRSARLLGADACADWSRQLEKLRKSLRDYATRSKELRYVSLVGLFNSGKSATLNSVLGLWGTRDELDTGLHPTTQSITLITHPCNASSVSLMAQVADGAKVVRTFDLDLLRSLVLIDTPGVGDPHAVETLAKDFLPTCDLVLFVFSAAAALTEADALVLKELHQHLRFIPLRFVVTRANEFAANSARRVGERNLDKSSAEAFIAGCISRMQRLPAYRAYARGDFLLIDNKAGYNITELKSLLTQADARHRLSGPMEIHPQRVLYFLNSSIFVKDKLLERTDTRLCKLSEIIEKAEENIRKYDQFVKIRNNNMTMNWSEYAARLNEVAYREEVLFRPRSEPPRSVLSSLRVEETVAKQLVEQAEWAELHGEELSQRFERAVSQAASRLIADAHRRIEELDFGNVTTELATNPAASDRLDLAIALPMTLVFAQAQQLRSAIWEEVHNIFGDVQRGCDALAMATRNLDCLHGCKRILQTAQATLDQDMGSYFQSVGIYRAGVFAKGARDQIGTLGVGRGLDELESEFTAEQEASLQRAARHRLFPMFDEKLADAEASAQSIVDALHGFGAAGAPGLCPPPTMDHLIRSAAEAARSHVIEECTGAIHREVERMASVMADVLATAMEGARKAYDEQVGTAKRNRKRFHAYIAVAAFALCVVSSASLLSTEARATIGNELVIGAIASLLATFVWGIVSKAVEVKPENRMDIMDRQRRVLVESVNALRSRSDFVPRNPLPTAAAAALLRSALVDVAAYRDPWREQIEATYEEVRRLVGELNRLRRAYLETVNAIAGWCQSYFDDPKKNGATMDSVASQVKDVAVKPSFDLLRATAEEYRTLRETVRAVALE